MEPKQRLSSMILIMAVVYFACASNTFAFSSTSSGKAQSLIELIASSRAIDAIKAAYDTYNAIDELSNIDFEDEGSIDEVFGIWGEEELEQKSDELKGLVGLLRDELSMVKKIEGVEIKYGNVNEFREVIESASANHDVWEDFDLRSDERVADLQSLEPKLDRIKTASHEFGKIVGDFVDAYGSALAAATSSTAILAELLSIQEQLVQISGYAGTAQQLALKLMDEYPAKSDLADDQIALYEELLSICKDAG